MTKTSDLKQLVDNLVSLNDDDLAQRVRADSDVQWCLSELQDILAANIMHGPNCVIDKLKHCPFCGGKAKFLIKAYTQRENSLGYEFGICCSGCGKTTAKTNYAIEIKMAEDGEFKILTDERHLAEKEWNRRFDNG